MRVAGRDIQETPQVYAEQVAQLFRHVPLTTTFNLLNGLILVAAQWSQIETEILLAWLGGLYLLSVCRLAHALCFNRSRHRTAHIRTWNATFIAGVFLTGSAWGCAALIMFPFDSIEHQSFLILMLAGMTAGAVSALSAQMSCFLAFAIPALMPLSLRLVDLGTQFSTFVAGMTLLFLIGMTVAARGVNRTILSSLYLRYDNDELSKEISNRLAAENALFEEKERLQTTLAALSEGVVIISAGSHIIYLNPAAEKLSGWKNEEAAGLLMESVFCGVDERNGKWAPSAVREALARRRHTESECVLISRRGDQRLIKEIATPLQSRSGEIVGAVAILRDITSERRHSRELAYQASHDALTHLPNRLVLWDRLNHAIERAARGSFSVAVLFMDLDRFKTVNDSLGHAAGDVLLKIVAKRLRSCLRKEDTVARLGGDEFVIILEQVHGTRWVASTARKITEVIAKPMVIEGNEFIVTASIGVTLFPKDGNNAEILLKNADTAMYRAKEQGRNDVRFYSEEMNAQALSRLKIEQQLRRAISKKELELYYQPKIDLATGGIAGTEALLRWRKSNGDLVLPSDFIPIAEETGCINEIGEWVLATACRQAKDWRQRGLTNLRMAVNFSPRQIQQSNVRQIIEKTLNETKLEPAALELEITETACIGDIENSIQTLRDLKRLGVQLAIDDFGTGYSSLTCLKHFPVDILKIDKSFVQDIQDDPSDAAIVSSIIFMGHGLDMTVIAEGVETPTQLNYLRRRNCDGYQGYLFSRPLPVEDVYQLMRSRKIAS